MCFLLIFLIEIHAHILMFLYYLQRTYYQSLTINFSVKMFNLSIIVRYPTEKLVKLILVNSTVFLCLDGTNLQ